MGSKTAKSTQAITIPPEVLARYNAVNARADTVTNRPFQQYGGEFVAPLSYAQSEGIANTMGAARMAQPYFADATGYLIGAQADARNYYNNATGQLNQGIEQGNQFAGQSTDSLNKAQRVGDTFAGQSQRALGQAQGVGNYFAGQSQRALGQAQDVGNQLATQSYGALRQAQGVGNQLAGQSYNTLGQAQDVGSQLAGQSLGTINAAQNRADQIQQGALGNLGAAYMGAQPYNQLAGGQYAQGLGQGQDLTGASSYGTQQALMGAQPFQQIATQFMGSGAQAVNPNELGADQINKYLSPYLGTVLQGTAGLLNQQNQQQQAGQMGNAIRSGAFGGDRAGIAAANLNQQQNLANAQIFSGILNQGFGQALNTAQQQQQLGLGAAQANRAAQQQAAQQALGIGQQGFGQGLAAAQQQGNLGQQLFGMGSTTGQNLAALGQQIYGQGTGTAQAQAALAQQQFGQGATTAAQQAALGQQQFGQGATAAAQQAALGQQQFGQGATAAERLASLGQQQFGQGATVAERQAALGQQQFGQGATTAGQLASLGQQQFGQGATTAAQQAALGQQQFGQGLAASQQGAAIGRGIYDTGANTAAQTAAMGVSAQDAALSGAAAQMTAGQVDQATRQAENTARYNQFLQEQSLPYQQLKLASDIALGTGTAQGSTTTTTQPGGFFSDERLKENIKAVGKTFDGQTIHSFNYKGDPRTQIGLIAQEVQKHHPDAVGLAGGYKTVNYDKATEDAADRGHMAYGGLASAGGSVLPQDAGQGFAAGGLAGFDPATMQQLLAAQQAMYDPIMKGNMYAGGPNAAGGLVPQSEFVARQLMMPGELPATSSGLDDAAKIASLGKNVGEIGDKFGAWDWDEDEKSQNANDSKKKKALGGEIPYSNQITGPGLDIPTGGLANAPQLMTASPLQQKQSGFSKLLGAAGDVASIFNAVKKKASGGEIPYESNMSGKGLDIPEEDGSPNKYELKTAGEMPDKPESDLDKIGKIAQIAGTVAAMSDKRMKENIKAIGKLFDGQVVHSFNYKGDPRTQIGLIAQEVEDHKPHAVGVAGGMKTVDYDKATSGAARRGHFAMGGQPMDAGLMGAGMAGLNEADREPDFNLDPEDIISGGDPDMEFFMRDSLKKPESPAQAAGLGALENKSAEILKAYKPKAPIKPRPTGLAPKAGGLPKNVMQIARLIRAGEGTGQNPDSTAIGPYQMIDKTFAGQFRKQYPDRARGMSDRDIIALKRSPEGAALSEAMGPKLIEGNARIIERGGFEPDAGNVYLAHFLGPDTAVKVLRADPNAPIANYVSEEAIMANPPLQKNPTVGGVIDWARGSMAKQASRLSRASGGLAGRNGYADAGAVDEDPDMVARRLFETTDTPTEEATPTGVAPPQAAAPAAPAAPPAGLAAGEMANSYPEQTVTQSKIKPSVPSASLPKLNASLPSATLPAPNTSPRPNIYGVGDQKPVNYEGGRVPNYSYDYMTEPFFKGLKKGKASSIIPLLTGIAAMGTAKTVNPLVAAAAGLGAGAESYAGLANERNKQLVQRQIGTARYADSVRALFEREAVPLPNGNYFYRGKEINQSEYDQMLKAAINNDSGVMLPEIPATAKTYMPPTAPEPAKPVPVTDKPDMTTTQGIYAAAYNDSIVRDARDKQANARKQIADLQAFQSDPRMQTNPNSISVTNSRLATANTALADATATVNDRLSQLTGVPLASLGEGQRTVFDQTMEKASTLETKKEALRPTMLLFKALETSGYKGGTGQDVWAKVADFVKNFGNLTDDEKKLISSSGDEVSRQKLMEVIGGPVFDPKNPGKALIFIKEKYFNPAYLDLEAQIKAIKPFAQPTGAPQSSVGVSPPIVSPPAERPPSAAAQQGADGVWRGRTLQDLMSNPAVPKGATIRYQDANGRIVQGKK